MISLRRTESISSSRVVIIDSTLLKDIDLFVVSRKNICSEYLDSKFATVLYKPLIYLNLMSKLYYTRVSA